MDINASKYHAVIISSKNKLKKLNYAHLPDINIDGQRVEYVENVRELGFQLNRTITTECHTKEIQQNRIP